MKKILLLFSLVTVFNSWAVDRLNAIIGNQSYIEKFGALPTPQTDETVRIATHLEYVEKELRAVPQANLSVSAWQNRQEMLDLLHTYWQRKSFPQLSTPSDSRMPCFIDDRGVLCAVAYLISETSGMQHALAINRRHHFDYLLDMNEVLIDLWAEKYGFTLRELAMIQPTYSHMNRPVEPIEPPIDFPREHILERNLVRLRRDYDLLKTELEQTKLRVDLQSDTIIEQKEMIANKETELLVAQTENSALETEKTELSEKVVKKKRWNIGLTGVATSLAGITVFQWIKIRKEE